MISFPRVSLDQTRRFGHNMTKKPLPASAQITQVTFVWSGFQNAGSRTFSPAKFQVRTFFAFAGQAIEFIETKFKLLEREHHFFEWALADLADFMLRIDVVVTRKNPSVML